MQTSDSRIRVGSSVTTESCFNYNEGKDRCESIKEEEEAEEGGRPLTTTRACDSSLEDEDGDEEEGPPPPATTTTHTVDLETLNEAKAWL